MGHDNKQQSRLTSFFNARAKSYTRSAFVEYLFTQREIAAYGEGLPKRASVLDLGCGTGRMYTFLHRTHPEDGVTYLGLDPAAKMLEASSIPEQLRRVGDVSALTTEDGPFDRIYLLGVTTYLPDEVLLPTLSRLIPKLRTDGRLVVQYTNADSLEVRIRQGLRPLLRKLLPGRHVASGEFSIYPRSVGEAMSFDLPLSVAEKRLLPANVPFLQYLSPHLAIRLSRRLGGWAPNWLRMDFLVTYQLR